MLDFVNKTSWSGGVYPGWGRDRDPQYTVVVKVDFVFDLSGNLEQCDQTSPVVEADTYFGDPLRTGLKAASETVPFKRGSEFYLYGTVYPPGEGKAVTEAGVGIAFPDGSRFRKILRVFGKREWKHVMMNPVVTGPAALEPIPLRYEFAFGGANPNNPDEVYPLNPVGMGINGKGWKIANTELPHIEQPGNLISRPADTPPPAGFAPLPVFWEPRASEAGEPNQDAIDAGLCPYSEHAEDCLHNYAPPDQRFDTPFQGDEVVYLAGFFRELSLKETVRISLPSFQPGIYTIINDKADYLEGVCDTLVIDTDCRRMSLLYRAAIPAPQWESGSGWVVVEDRESEQQPGRHESPVSMSA